MSIVLRAIDIIFTLMATWAVVALAILLLLGDTALTDYAAPSAFLLASVITSYGIFVRKRWGWISGLLLCTICLLSYPYGMIVGAPGILLLLFGRKSFPDRSKKKAYQGAAHNGDKRRVSA